VKLPETKKEPTIEPKAYNWLFTGSTDGIGKSSLLASCQDLLILDPDQSCKALPGYILDIPNWRDALEALRTLQKGEFPYSGIGIDNLNIFYDHLFLDFVKREKHPGDANDMGKTWNKLTREWITWLRSLRATVPNGYFIATAHTNIIEISIKSQKFNKYVPAIPGGGPRGAYRQTMELFDITGFITREAGEEAGKPPKDARQEILRLTTEERIVVHFLPSVYWEAKDNSRQLPFKIELTDNWQEDWNLILNNWKAKTC